MNSLTSLVLDLQAPNLAVVAAGKQNDLMSRQIAATLRDGDAAFTPPAGVAAMIRYAKPDGTAGWYDVMEDGTTPAYTISGNVITFIMCEQMLTVPGCVPVEINFYTSTEKLTTFSFMLQVEKSVLTDNTIISSDYYNVLSAQIQALLGATANPPKIDPVTKNWLLWDEDLGVYVDSGFSSIGTTGPQGPQGVSITTVTKASGTGAAGTTDVYNVNKSDGTVAGQFNVYNGADGQGSPGAATPLTDSGSGVVGTAVAYSREDHRHPLNVDSTNPSALGTASPGTASTYARRDHVHPMPTIPAASTSAPADLGTADAGTSDAWARGDHVHNMPDFADVGAWGKTETIWTNASPSSSFAGQTLTIPTLSNYTGIIVAFGEPSYGEDMFALVKVAVNNGLFAMKGYDGAYRRWGRITSGTELYISDVAGGSNGNTNIIPKHVYGFNGAW